MKKEDKVTRHFFSTKQMGFVFQHEVRYCTCNNEDAKTNNETILQADRSIMQRLIAEYQAGREMNMSEFMKHKLMPVPISLANTDGTLRTGDKCLLADILTDGVDCPNSIHLLLVS